MSSLKSFIKLFLPPIIILILKKFRRKSLTWEGNFQSWSDACSKTTSYSKYEIMEKCKKSLLEVVNGRAVHERDSVLFDKIQYSWPVMGILQFCGRLNYNKLHVLDFGGSFGSSYYQNRKFLKNFDELKWSIVEQKDFVTEGKKYFENNELKFFYDVNSCVSSGKVNIVLFSSVLQYLDSPFELLRDLFKYKIDYIVIDLTPVYDLKNRIAIQKVPEVIYNASYPCWIFNEIELINFFKTDYELIEDFDAFLGNDLLCDSDKFRYRGYFFKRRQA